VTELLLTGREKIRTGSTRIADLNMNGNYCLCLHVQQFSFFSTSACMLLSELGMGWGIYSVGCLQTYSKIYYYMASSVSGQNESNPVLWLATRAGKMELSCPLGTTRRVPQEKLPRKSHNKSFIDQACSVKMAGYWPCSFLASLWTSTPSRSINTQKKNEANFQSSGPHTWSITHTYVWYQDTYTTS